MKGFLKFAPHALIIAVLAALMQLLDIKAGDWFYAWIGFAAWACYFLAGCTVKGGAKVIGCWVTGVIASIAIIELGMKLTGMADGNGAVGFPVAVGFIAFFVILFEKVPALDFIPAWFIGAACFFAANNFITVSQPDLICKYSVSVPVVLVSCIVGQVFGYVTVFLRTKYGAMIAEGDAETAAE